MWWEDERKCKESQTDSWNGKHKTDGRLYLFFLLLLSSLSTSLLSTSLSTCHIRSKYREEDFKGKQEGNAVQMRCILLSQGSWMDKNLCRTNILGCMSLHKEKQRKWWDGKLLIQVEQKSTAMGRKKTYANSTPSSTFVDLSQANGGLNTSTAYGWGLGVGFHLFLLVSECWSWMTTGKMRMIRWWTSLMTFQRLGVAHESMNNDEKVSVLESWLLRLTIMWVDGITVVSHNYLFPSSRNAKKIEKVQIWTWTQKQNKTATLAHFTLSPGDEVRRRSRNRVSRNRRKNILHTPVRDKVSFLTDGQNQFFFLASSLLSPAASATNSLLCRVSRASKDWLWLFSLLQWEVLPASSHSTRVTKRREEREV